MQSLDNMTSFKFKAVLLEISNQLSSDQLNKIKFLCQDMIGKKEMETIDTGIKLFRVLEERGKLAADNREYLCHRLTEIKRHDLLERLKGFESLSGSADDQPDEQEKAKLDIATEVITENLGKNWRRLGRKLGLTEVRLESISKRHPTELEETAVELLKEWRKIQGAKARTEDLLKALRACQFNLTAEKVEEKLSLHG